MKEFSIFSLLIFHVIFSFFLASCSSSEQQFEKYREEVRSDMRDPESAVFRNEKIRNLWSTQGSRLKIYCADVNGKNAFGGMTGFNKAMYIISSKSVGAGTVSIFEAGLVMIEPRTTRTYYLQCERTDTQRSNSQFFSTFSEFTPYNESARKEVDEAEPVLSTAVAPENR